MKKLLMPIFSLFSFTALAQNDIASGAQALQDLTGDLQNYIDPLTTVIYVAAVLVGLVGAFKVYTAWQNSKDNTLQIAAGWFGSMIFLLVANVVLKAMFI